MLYLYVTNIESMSRQERVCEMLLDTCQISFFDKRYMLSVRCQWTSIAYLRIYHNAPCWGKSVRMRKINSVAKYCATVWRSRILANQDEFVGKHIDILNAFLERFKPFLWRFVLLKLWDIRNNLEKIEIVS